MIARRPLDSITPRHALDPVGGSASPPDVRIRLRRFARSLAKRSVHCLRQSYYCVRALGYAGHEVTCPYCLGQFRRFLPHTNGSRRPNACCPRCGSKERDRLLLLYLNECTNLFTDYLKVLHVAPELFLSKLLIRSSNVDYLSADLNSPFAMVQMDVTRISYPDEWFDVVICNHVLQFVEDDRQALAELFRVLQPDGWAILQVPIKRGLTREEPRPDRNNDREPLFGKQRRRRLYGKDYKYRLERAGFVVKVDQYARGLGADAWKKYGLMPDEEIYFCTKPHD